jgi:undecaprenyl-diphosphatase
MLLPKISRSGDGYWYPFVAAFLFLLNNDMACHFLAAAAISFGIELPLYKIIKRIVKRDRPFKTLKGVECLVVPSDKFSFPSGHTAAATIMAMLLSYFIPALTLPLFIWAILVGFSRIYVGVHYPSDILAGMLLGSLSGSTGLAVCG